MGDYNDDLVVDAADYVIWRTQSGETGTGLSADGNNDQTVNQLDYDLWKANFGASVGGFASAAQLELVPEPSAALLICCRIGSREESCDVTTCTKCCVILFGRAFYVV